MMMLGTTYVENRSKGKRDEAVQSLVLPPFLYLRSNI